MNNKPYISLFLISGLVLGLLYTATWFYIASELERKIDQFYIYDGPVVGIKFDGKKPTVSGFPGYHVISYNEGIRLDRGKDKDLGFFFPTVKITRPLTLKPKYRINFPEIFGIHTASDLDGSKLTLKFDQFSFDMLPPESVTLYLQKFYLEEWRKSLKPFHISNIKIAAKNIKIEGEGSFQLDKNLQPLADLNVRISGLQDFLNIFLKNSLLSNENKQAILLSSNPERVLTLKNTNLTLDSKILLQTPTINW